MKPIPYILIKCAMTLDGYLDDTSDKRLILSNEKDFAEVEKVRESCDAILVGAQTIRKDNPRLVLKSGKLLKKVTITSSGNIDPNSNFFTMGKSEKIVYTTSTVTEKLKNEILDATIVSFDNINDIRIVLEDLYERGVRRLLVEGGSSIISQFLNEKLVDELQISIAPLILGEENAPRFIKEELLKHSIQLTLQSTKELDDMIVLTYKPNLSSRQLKGGEISNEQNEISHAVYTEQSRSARNDKNDNDKKWLEYTIKLSKNCAPSENAFAVGAALVDKNGNLIAEGFSGETDSTIHAEEIVFEKIKEKNLDLSEATVYSSLEPCNTRLSKSESCVDLIFKYGINRIVFAVTEPPIFVEGKGAERLIKEGKEVIQLAEYEQEVMNIQCPQIQQQWGK